MSIGLMKTVIIISAVLLIGLGGAGVARAQSAAPDSSKSREAVADQIRENARRHAQNDGRMQTQAVLELFRDNAAGFTPSEVASIYEEEYTRQKENEPFYKRFVPNASWFVAVLIVSILMTLLSTLLHASMGKAVDYVSQSLYQRFAGTSPFRGMALRYYKRALAKRYQKVILPFDRISVNILEMFVPPALSGVPGADNIDALRAVTELKRLVILGAPGSGKSALLTSIASSYAEGPSNGILQKTTPVLVQLYKLSAGNRSLQQLVVDSFAANDFPDSKAFVLKSLWEGKLLLLLDGLDEVSFSKHDEAVDQIRGLLVAYPQTRAVITSRTATYRDEFRDLVDATCTILDLDDLRIQRFLKAWEPRMPQGKSAAQLMESLRKRPRIMALARSRLLLTLILYFYSSAPEYQLPSSRAELCRLLTEVLLDKWDNRRRNQFNFNAKQSVLERLALHIQDNFGSPEVEALSLPYRVAAQLVRHQLVEINLHPQMYVQMLEEIVEGSGLLLAIDGGERYQFSHLILLEYFSASALAEDVEGIIERFVHNPVLWRETIKMCCGLMSDSTRLLASLNKIDTTTAFECLAEVRAVDGELAENIISAAEGMLGDVVGGVAITRAFGTVAAGPGLIGDRIFGYLEETLNSAENPARHLAAAEALSLTNMPRAATLLASHYSTYPEVRALLIGMGDLAVPALLSLAHAGKDEVLADLKAIGTPAATEALAELAPILSKQIKNLSGRSLDITIDGRSGFYVGKKEKLRLRVINLLDEPLEDVLIELEDTAKYSVDGVADGGAPATRLTLPAGESEIISYLLFISEPGQLDLQLKVNGKVYKDHPLELYATHDNPYIYGPPIKDRYNYFGREEEFNTILNDVQGETGAHRLLIGEQRSGKTSLLYILKDTIQHPVIPVYITLENMPGAPSGGGDEIAAFEWILDRIIYELKELGVLDREKEYQTGMKYGDYFGRHLRSLIRELQATTRGARLCLLVDEGNRILKLREEFQLVMRATLNDLGRDMRMILACSNEFLEYVQESRSSPFKNVFQYTLLRPISDNDLNKLIIEPARRFGYEYEEDAVRRVREMSGGHPYYVQALCGSSFNKARGDGSSLISLAHVEAAVVHVVNSKEVKDKFVLGYWNVLKDDPEAIRFLKLLSAGRDAGKTPPETIDKLKGRQIIVEFAPRQYRFSAELFRIWVGQLSNPGGAP